MSANARIAPTHLGRGAYVYVRQSTEYQVQNHLQSQERQYELAEVAVGYGWARLAVLLAVLLSVDALSGEIDSGVMQTLAVKPIRRADIGSASGSAT